MIKIISDWVVEISIALVLLMLAIAIFTLHAQAPAPFNCEYTAFTPTSGVAWGSNGAWGLGLEMCGPPGPADYHRLVTDEALRGIVPHQLIVHDGSIAIRPRDPSFGWFGMTSIHRAQVLARIWLASNAKDEFRPAEPMDVTILNKNLKAGAWPVNQKIGPYTIDIPPSLSDWQRSGNWVVRAEFGTDAQEGPVNVEVQMFGAWR